MLKKIKFIQPARERIELKHQAHSRECFANGSIKAIKFIVRQNENRIYTMRDILNP